MWRNARSTYRSTYRSSYRSTYRSTYRSSYRLQPNPRLRGHGHLRPTSAEGQHALEQPY
jgi:hypothetical protein